MHLRTFAAALVLLISAIRPGAAEPTAPVLVYHRFDSAHPAAMTVTTPVFAEQLASLTSRNIAVVRLHELVDRLHNGVNLRHLRWH